MRSGEIEEKDCMRNINLTYLKNKLLFDIPIFALIVATEGIVKVLGSQPSVPTCLPTGVPTDIAMPATSGPDKSRHRLQ